MTKSKIKKVTLSLDEETLEILSQLSNIGYGSISASIRILVKKYGNKEIQLTTNW